MNVGVEFMGSLVIIEKERTRKLSVENGITVLKMLDFLANFYGQNFMTYVYDPHEKRLRMTAIGDIVVLVNYHSVDPQRFNELKLKDGDIVTITEPIC